MIAALVLAATVALEPRVTIYRTPNKQIPTEIAQHAGKLWFVSWHTQPLRAYFGRIDKRGRMRTQPAPAGHMPGLMANAPDGTLWLTDASKPLFWRIDGKGKVTTVKTVFPAIGIAYGPDGRLWCTHQSSLITRHGVDGSEQGTFTIPFDQPMTSSLPGPPGPNATWIVAGPDGALWFLENYTSKVGRITTSGEITLFQAPLLADFAEIVATRDALWFSVYDALLGRIAPSGEVTTVKIGQRATPLAVDTAGRVWYGANNLAGYVDTDGLLHEFEVPGARHIRSMAAGPDGAMWFADDIGLVIGRIELRPASPRRP